MDCKIVKNTDGKINGVLNQTGQPSSLFKQIFNTPTLSLDEAIELYKNIYSEKLQEKVIYQQLFDSLAQELQYIKQSAVANGTFMKAPNGQPTNLTEAQWLQTRTNNFKNWFGDWEKSPENASKVIDENGEPLVVFHGTEDSFTEFIANKTIERVFHFGSILSAKERVRYNRGKEAILMPTFLNIRNMARTGDFFEGKKLVKSRINHYVDKFDSGESLIEEGKMLKRFTNIKEGLAPKLYDFYSDLTGLKGVDFEDYLDDTINKLSEKNKQEEYDKNKDIDGLVYKNTEEGVGTDSYIVLQPNQIKSATENIGTFSIETNDIRFQVIGEKGTQNLDQIEEATFRMDNLKVAREMEAAGKTSKEVRLATGWEKGIDGLFRYEILDGTLNKVGLNYNVILREFENKVAKVSLEELYTNNELYKAYPKLKNTSVYFYESENPLYDENIMFVSNGTIYINKRDYDKDLAGGAQRNDNGAAITKKISHEVSHLIQQTEGFASGSSEEFNRQKVRESIKFLRGRSDENDRRQGDDGRYDEYIQRVLRNKYPKEIAESALTNNIPIEAVVNSISNTAYKNFAGEVEARNVENRFFMSPQQRLEQTLQETQDIPFEDQFVLQFKNDIQSSQRTAPQITQEIIDKLKQNGLSKDVFLLSTEEINAKLIELGEENVKNTTTGFVFENQVYINKDLADDSVLLHEYNHLFLNWAKTARPELYAKGIDLIKKELKKGDKSEIKDIFDFVNVRQPTLTGDALIEEYLTEFVGRESKNMMDEQKAKSPLMQWLLDFWTSIKDTLSLTSMTPEQVANLNLKEFARASVVDLLKGERIKGQEAQEYFTRNADRLPLTLAVFSRPEFVKLQGKQINPITVLNSLNQSGIKQIEKDLIKQVIEDNYKGQTKINYDELEATVRANIMPLERIFTSSYANYGMDNLGDGNYGEANTIILNAPIEHGVTGHFSGDFKASGRKNIKYQTKQLDANTWVAVEEGYEANANDNNIYQYVGTAGTKEAVDAWISNYNGTLKVGGIVAYEHNRELKSGVIEKINGDEITIRNEVFDTIDIVDIEQVNEGRIATSTNINKGMFGHIRVWQDGEVFTVAELQSDTYQKNKAKELFIKQSNINKKAKENVKDRIFNKIVFEKVSKWEYEASIEGVKLRITEQDGEYFPFIDGEVLPDIFDNIEDAKKEIKKGLDFFELESFTKELEKEKIKVEQEFLKSLLPQEKQFIASQKIWEQRMVREAIKEASLSGATSLRFPTPYTLSVIEGYIKDENSDSTKLPYSIVQNLQYGSEYNDESGNIIELKPTDLITIEGQAYAVTRVVDDYIKIKNVDYDKSLQYTEEKFEKEFGEKVKIGVNQVNGIEYSYTGEGVIYFLQGGQETFGQPSKYINQEAKKSWNFKISDLNDTQQTVARKYEEIAEILKKEKPVEVVTDENGFDWYEAKIEQSDVNKPVVAFQKILLKETSQKAVEPNLSFETPKGETFDNYSDALKNTDEGLIKLKIDDTVIGEVSSSTDISTVIGSINDLVKQSILKGERLLNPNGTISHVTNGNSLAKKLINATISEDLLLGNQVKPSIDDRGNISIAEKQSFYEGVKNLDYKQIKVKHGADIANIILAARVYEENVKPFGQKRFIEDKQEITPENELQEKLLNLLNTLGVKTVSLNKYKESYKQRNGALPSSNALADIANRVIAFTDGEVTQDVLTEEVSHFILEAVNQEELAPLLENIHKTDEWAQYAEEYFKIYQDEATVRKEILGKVLKNAIQRNFEKSQQTGTANTIIGKLAEIFNKFFTRISEFLTPQHRIDLDEYTKKIYDNLMLGELVNELNQEQLEGNHLVLFQTSKNIQSEADLLLSKLNKALEHVEAQDRRLNSVSREEILTLKESLTITNTDNEEDDIARATLSISNITNRHINYLVKRDKRNLLSSEESAVFSLTVGYLAKVLTELESIISKKSIFPNKALISKELGRTLESIRKLQGDVGISQEQNVQRIFDKVSEELDLDDATKKQLLDNFNSIQRDTNVFYAYVGGAINAHNPALNVASALISKAYADKNITFNVKSKEFINFAKSKGYTEEQLAGVMSKWKRGHHLFSRFNFAELEKDMLEEKVKIFKEVFGKEVTTDQLLKNEDTLLKAEPTETKKIYYKKVNDFRQENQVYSPLTEEETKKSNAIYAQVSLETQMKDRELSRQRSAITREAKRNNGFSEAEKFEMEELVRKRATLKNPFDNQGKLKSGLALNEEDEIIIADGFTIDTLEADSKLVYELNLLDRLKAENFKNSLEETALPKKFIDALNAIDGDKEKLEFIKLNANISFSSEFWDTFDRSVGVVSKLREKGEYVVADEIQKTTTRRKHILKANRVFNNPSETNYEDLSGETELTLKELEGRLEDLYKQANKVLDKEDRVGNKMSELVTNQAYRNELADSDLITTAQKIDFIKTHVTESNKNKIESARLAVESYKNGFRKDLPKSLKPFILYEEDANLDDALIAYAETKLASYFKKLQPVGFDYNNLLTDIVSNPTAFFTNMPKNVSVVPNYIFLGQDENSRVNPKFAKNIEEGEPQLQLYTNTPEYKGTKRVDYKYGDKDFADYFGIDDLENPKAAKNEKEYEVLQALYKFQDDTITKADMKDKHSRYLLPQKRPETLNRIANIKADSKGNLKEGFKELFAYREDDAIYGQKDGKMNLGKTAIGEMTIPRHGFNRMETAEEVTNELLYSYMWMAEEAELRKSRVSVLGDIESIRTILANKSYGDKHGESTTTYKMFDDFVRFNMYGQSEAFSFETNFGILSKKVNLAPLIKKFQSWIRLVNLGFGVLTPITSFLQGSVNFQIEEFVGERIDKDASRLARKQLVKLLPETMSDVMKLTSSSKLNILSEFMGQDSSLERFKNSNYNRLTRGISQSAYMTHGVVDVPFSAQVLLTVLHDFRIVDGRLTTFAKFVEENRSKTRKEARTAWAAYEDKVLYNYIKIKNGVASITDELRNEVPDIDKRMQNVRNSITVAKQEIDSQIPSTDRTQMQRHALLSFLTLHKGWLITSMTRRFKSKHLNLYTGLEEEGSYSGTFGSDSFFSDLVQSWKKDGISYKAAKENWKNSSVTRRRSMQRVAADVAVTNALVLVALLLKGWADDDKDKDFVTQFTALMSYRLANEVTSQSTAFSNQVYKFLENPTVGLAQIQNLLDITDLTSSNTINSGMYKDLSKSEAWFFKSLPALKEYWKLTNIERSRKQYEYFNSPVISYFSVAGTMMKESKEKEE